MCGAVSRAFSRPFQGINCFSRRAMMYLASWKKDPEGMLPLSIHTGPICHFDVMFLCESIWLICQLILWVEFVFCTVGMQMTTLKGQANITIWKLSMLQHCKMCYLTLCTQSTNQCFQICFFLLKNV